MLSRQVLPQVKLRGVELERQRLCRDAGAGERRVVGDAQLTRRPAAAGDVRTHVQEEQRADRDASDPRMPGTVEAGVNVGDTSMKPYQLVVGVVGAKVSIGMLVPMNVAAAARPRPCRRRSGDSRPRRSGPAGSARPGTCRCSSHSPVEVTRKSGVVASKSYTTRWSLRLKTVGQRVEAERDHLAIAVDDRVRRVALFARPGPWSRGWIRPAAC